MALPHTVRILITSRALRGFADGYVAVLLPAYLLALGLNAITVGFLSTATLLGSALATLAVGAIGHRVERRRLMLAAAALMVATGLAFASLSAFAPLLLVAFVGTLNPSSGDVSVFLPLEHAQLADSATDKDQRSDWFARYTLAGSLAAAFGALASALPAWAALSGNWTLLTALRAMFVVYALIGVAVWALYRLLPVKTEADVAAPAPLGPSRRSVFKLAALFSVDSFGGGFLINALLAQWLFQRFGLSLAAAGSFFFWSGLLTTGSQLVAPILARRIGLLNTMVYTHIPASLFLICAAVVDSLPVALALLLARSALSQMDVPARAAFVMAVVTKPERAAAASFTAVPRSLASAVAPTFGGALLAAGLLAAPLVACGAIKIAYDLALLWTFRDHPIE
jgi:MFS family permease